MDSCQGDKKQALHGWEHCQEQLEWRALEWSDSRLLHFRKPLHSSGTPLQPIICPTGDFVTGPQLLLVPPGKIPRSYMDSVLGLVAYYPVGIGRTLPVVPSISLARERQHRMVGNRASLRIELPLLNCWLFCLLTGEATYSSGPSVFTSDKGNNNGILVRWGFHNNVSRIGWLRHQGFMFSQFWRLQDWDQGVGNGWFLQMAAFSLCPRMVFPLGISLS